MRLLPLLLPHVGELPLLAGLPERAAMASLVTRSFSPSPWSRNALGSGGADLLLCHRTNQAGSVGVQALYRRFNPKAVDRLIGCPRCLCLPSHFLKSSTVLVVLCCCV
jgi:hypothetical protein